jgi:hypothetical protein
MRQVLGCGKELYSILYSFKRYMLKQTNKGAQHLCSSVNTESDRMRNYQRGNKKCFEIFFLK